MIFTNGHFVVLSCNIQLKIYSLESGNQAFTIELPAIQVKADQTSEKNDSGYPNGCVICGGFSSSSKLLAVCDNNKRLIIWKFDESGTNWKFQREFKVARRCVKLVFTSDEKRILVGDKSGDVYVYDMSSTGNNEGSLLMGHLSMLLDFDLTSNQKYLITCDRDEKIRVSYFPNSYNIHGYCLGHTEFVSSFCFIGDFLLSGSGDSTMRIWNYETGNEVTVYDCSVDVRQNDQKTAIKQVAKLCNNLIAVLFYGLGDVLLYKIDQNGSECIISLVKRVNACSSPIHKILLFKKSIILVTVKKNDMFIGFDFNDTCNSFDPTNNSQLITLIQSMNAENKFIDQFYQIMEMEEKSLETLYKTWFNNVETYLEKKKERQAKKLKTKNSK